MSGEREKLEVLRLIYGALDPDDQREMMRDIRGGQTLRPELSSSAVLRTDQLSEHTSPQDS